MTTSADTATTLATLPTSAHRETVWARALQVGLERHGPTPTFEQVAVDLGFRPSRDGAGS